MGHPRYRIDQEFVQKYKAVIQPSEFFEDFDDRNALHACRHQNSPSQLTAIGGMTIFMPGCTSIRLTFDFLYMFISKKSAFLCCQFISSSWEVRRTSIPSGSSRFTNSEYQFSVQILSMSSARRYRRWSCVPYVMFSSSTTGRSVRSTIAGAGIGVQLNQT